LRRIRGTDLVVAPHRAGEQIAGGVDLHGRHPAVSVGVEVGPLVHVSQREGQLQPDERPFHPEDRIAGGEVVSLGGRRGRQDEENGQARAPSARRAGSPPGRRSFAGFRHKLLV